MGLKRCKEYNLVFCFFYNFWIWRQKYEEFLSCALHLFILLTVRCSTSMAWETMIHSKSNKKHDRKSERILSGALKISSQLVQMSLSCKTWLISSFLFPTINFHAKVIKRKYFSSAPWKQPCHRLKTVSRMLRIQQGTGFSSLLGLIWFPLLLFYWRITLMGLFWPKYAPAVFAAYITQYLYYVFSAALETLLSHIIAHMHLVKHL